MRATNPRRPRFTLSPYLIPLNPQLPPWLLTEHDSLRTAPVINNSPSLAASSLRPQDTERDPPFFSSFLLYFFSAAEVAAEEAVSLLLSPRDNSAPPETELLRRNRWGLRVAPPLIFLTSESEKRKERRGDKWSEVVDELKGRRRREKKACEREKARAEAAAAAPAPVAAPP